MTGNIKNFPGLDKLFQMRDQADGSRRFFYGDFEDRFIQFDLLHGERAPDATVQIHWSMGKAEPEDIANGLGSSWFYLSPKVQKLFRDQILTGWSTYPIVLHNKAGKICPGYAGLSITGRCGPIDKDRGKVLPGQEGKKFARHIGLYFEESTWDGSDFFCPAGKNSYMFATEKVKNVFEEHNIRGFDFTPLTQATWIP